MALYIFWKLPIFCFLETRSLLFYLKYEIGWKFTEWENNLTGWFEGAGTLEDLGAELGRVNGMEFLFPDTTPSSGVDDVDCRSSSKMRSIMSPHTCILGSTMKSMNPLRKISTTLRVCCNHLSHLTIFVTVSTTCVTNNATCIQCNAIFEDFSSHQFCHNHFCHKFCWNLLTFHVDVTWNVYQTKLSLVTKVVPRKVAKKLIALRQKRALFVTKVVSCEKSGITKNGCNTR